MSSWGGGDLYRELSQNMSLNIWGEVNQTKPIFTNISRMRSHHCETYKILTRLNRIYMGVILTGVSRSRNHKIMAIHNKIRENIFIERLMNLWGIMSARKEKSFQSISAIFPCGLFFLLCHLNLYPLLLWAVSSKS